MTDQQAADIARIERSLTNITPNPERIERIESLRASAKSLARSIIMTCEPSRERSLALTHLEEVTMWAVKAIILEAGDA